MAVDYQKKFQKNIDKAWLFFKDRVFDKYSGKYCVAGGSVLQKIQGLELESQQDIDLFFPDEAELNYVKDQLLMDGFEIYYENKNAYKLKNGDVYIDLIKHYRSSVTDVIMSFDFTICQVAFNKDGRFAHHRSALKHILHKRMYFTNNGDGFSSLKRLQKYSARGFKMDNRSLLRLAIKLKQLDTDAIHNELVVNRSKSCVGGFLSTLYKL